MKCLPQFKRGDTFSLVCTYKVDDVPVTIAGKTIASQIRRVNGALVSDVTVEPDTDPTKFILSADTENWPLDLLLCDIEIVEDGFTRSSETIQIPVVEDITR